MDGKDFTKWRNLINKACNKAERQMMDGKHLTTWRTLIDEARAEAGDVMPLLHFAPENLDLDAPFNDGFGGVEGASFTAWSETRVYFPVVYDGSEWVGSVPRHPCDEVTRHHGGA